MARVELKAGFKEISYYASTGGWRQITYDWYVWYYSAGQATGNGYAKASTYLKLFGNLYDKTALAWKLSNDLAVQVYSMTVYAPVGAWVAHQDAQHWTVSFWVELISGHTYQFYTYAMTYVYTDSVGGCAASCRMDLAGGDYAKLYKIDLSS